jgi:uncharacterized protein (DUF305 family)
MAAWTPVDDNTPADAVPVDLLKAGRFGDVEERFGEDLAAEDDALARRLGWAKVAILGAALAFLGFAVGLVVTRDRPPGKGSVDVGFYQDMLTHHEQAIGVAALVIGNGADPIVRSYAQEILTFQGYEIGVMTQRLADWGYSPSDRSDQAMGWMDMAVPLDRMPGLLTRTQMSRLRAAKGTALDQLFLEYMAEHHRGGLHMAEYASVYAHDKGVRDLAARIARNQAIEINEYRLLARRKGYDIHIEPAVVPSGRAD